MEAIKASPTSVNEVFQKQYIIPEYQRPYTWDRDQCGKLWDDITEAFHDSPNLEYFLGTTVLIKSKKSHKNCWEIIDGQQRLTTLLLLFKAFYKHHPFEGLKEILIVHDIVSKKPDPKQHRIESRVIEKDFESLKSVLNNSEDDLKNKFYDNFDFFYKNIEGRLKEDPYRDLHPLITFLLTQITILPIECGEEDSALKIFQTLNDRGTPLNDIDILKYKIYQHLQTQEEKDIFIEEWNDLENKESLFRIYMHILRAKDGEIGNVLQLRKYFENQINKDNSQKLFKDIKKIALFRDFSDTEVDFWKKNAIELFPIDLIIYPYFIFMYQYAEIEDGIVILSDIHKNQLIISIKDMLKFVYRKRSINSTKYDIFKACVSIYRKKLTDIFPKFEEHERETFENDLRNLTSRDKYTKSILSLYHILNGDQTSIALNTGFHVEHILPRAFQNYDGWTENDYKKYVNSLGNLTLWEKKLNTTAKNEFLSKKQELYKESMIIDVSDTKEGLLHYKRWTPEEVILRFDKIHKRLSDFIFS